jgi:propanol-preferring alcohol dehydrogenase
MHRYASKTCPSRTIELAAAPKPFEQAFGSLRRNGITVTGSIVGTRVDLAESYGLHASGRTTVIRETRSLEQVNDALGEVLDGRVGGRLVFDLC